MNILNDIWMAISTPNEGLVNICFTFLIIFIENPLSLFMICSIFNLKPSSKSKILYVLILSVVMIVDMYFIPSPFNIIINYIASFIVVYFIFKLNIINVILAAATPSIIFSIVGNLLLNPYLNIFNISYEQANTILIYRVTFALLMYLVLFCISLLFRYLKINFLVSNNFDKKDKTIIILNFILGIFTIAIQLILTFNYINFLPLTFTFLNFLSLLLYFSLSIYSLTRVMKLVNTTQKLESVEEFNKTLHILHDSVRGFKHDFDNIVTTIGGYIKTKDLSGLEKYYSQLQEDCQKVNNLYILNPDIINNPGIYNLLTTKYGEADEKGIKINLTFLLDLNNLHMKIYEFARILGILLDNAIEASDECDEKVLNMEFRNDSKNNRNIILIENTYKDKHINIDNIFNKGVSGKENHTGLGLWEIRQILKKNNNINLHTTKNDKYFSQQLEIYY